MARRFVDTSTVVKLYRAEPDSPAVRACVQHDDTLVISSLTHVEFRSALAGLARQGIATPGDVASLTMRYVSDASQYEVSPLTSATVGIASRLIDTYGVSHGLRSLDAVQIASALEVHSLDPVDSFISTDRVQRDVATAEGLSVLP